MRRIFFLLLLAISGSAAAQQRLIDIPVRAGVTLPVFWMPRDGAGVTVVLLPGGNGGFGQMVDGQPDGANFLVRSRDYFAAQGFNVALLGRPSDMADLGYAYRSGAEHVGDLKQVVAAIRQLSGQPIWLVGTSRGTVSATAAAIAFGNEQLAGLVLASSIVSGSKPGNIPSQALQRIRIPVLLLHHARDACAVTRPADVPAILQGLSQAPVKKLIVVDGGANPGGKPCGPGHWHGYVGMQKEAVETIAAWISNPTD